jgi:hypothetical protein
LTASTGYECVVPSDGVAYLLIEQKLLPNGSRLAHRITADDAEGLECELISVYRPCLNIRCNPNPTPLPDKYRQTRRDTTWESIADLLEVD